MDDAIVLTQSGHNVEAVYRADAGRLWRAIYAFSRDPEIADDAVAEAYAQLLRRGGEIRDPVAWTWRAGFKIARGALQSRSRADKLAITVQEHWDRLADQDLLAALQHLPDGQRAAVILFYYADLPIGEIAARLGSNGVAVRANLSRGRRRLRDLLGDRDA